MTHNPNPERFFLEKAVDQYLQALEQGDVDGVIRVLKIAENDPELDRVIGEVNLALDEELGLSPAANDTRLVRELLQAHLPSGFLDHDLEDQQLTVSDVAARLQAERRVPKEDQDANRELLHLPWELPEWLSTQEVKRLASQIRVQASDRFWKIFRETAIMMAMGRGQAQMAAARRNRNSQPSKSVAKLPEDDATHSRGQDDSNP